MISALQTSEYSSQRVKDPKTGKYRGVQGADDIPPAQYGNLHMDGRNAAISYAFGRGIKLSKRGK